MLLDRPGRFVVRFLEWGMSETKETGIPQFVAKCAIEQYFNEAQNAWEDWQDYDFTITAYMMLGKRDGSLNEVQIKSLKEALGWDGMDFAWLQDVDFTGQKFQIVVQEENSEKYGKQLRVAWINNINWEGFQLTKLNDDGLRGLNAKWAAKLRALGKTAGGGSVPGRKSPPAGTATGTAVQEPPPAEKKAGPVPAGKPPQNAPKGPPKPKSAPPTKATAPAQTAKAGTATQDEAWEVFQEVKSRAPQEIDIDGQWISIFEELFPGRSYESMTPEEWYRMKTEGASKIVPF